MSTLNDEGEVESYQSIICKTCGRKEAKPVSAAEKVARNPNESGDEEEEEEIELPAYVYKLCEKCG